MNTNLQQSLRFATNALSDFARGMNFWSGFELAFGQDYDREKAELIRQAAIDGTFMVPVRVIDDQSMGIASGAFAAATDTIYLRDSLVRSGDISSIGAVILEELGHAIDVRVNQIETPGDEGAIFQMLVNGYDICASLLAEFKREDDWSTIVVDNQILTVEMAVINGTLGNDSLTGTNADDIIDGLAGNDILIGGIGNDWLSGGDGNDSLLAGVGNDSLLGGFGDDYLDGSDGNDFLKDSYGNNTLKGGSGDDRIFAGIFDTIDGGIGIDTLELDYSKQILKTANITLNADGSGSVNGVADVIKGIESFTFLGSNSEDYINAAATIYSVKLDGSGGNDTLIGSNSNDSLFGGIGDDSLIANTGSDNLEGDQGKDFLDGGEGDDTLFGGTEDDTLVGGFGIDILDGWSGNDLLYGGDGNDSLYGGSENDTLHGGAGDDNLNDALGNNIINGDAGNDFIFAGIGSIVDGGVGIDELKLSYYGQSLHTANIKVNANGSGIVDGVINAFQRIEIFALQGSNGTDYVDASASTYTNKLDGQDGNDTLIGGIVDDTITGGVGDDSLNGGAGKDFILGGTGNDYLNGGDGNDSLNGGSGDDILDGSGDSVGTDSFAGETGNDNYGIYNSSTVIIEDAGAGNDTVWTAVNYTLAANIENMYLVGSLTGVGNAGDNIISGYGVGDNTIYGLAGNDTLYGGLGNDYLNGGVGNDFLDGGVGNDVFDGSGDSTGLDTFVGGAGDDTYGIYNSSTVIIEDAGAGNDTVWTAVNYTLAANVENMYLVGALTGNGNAGNNIIIGYGADNHIINGLGGDDSLYGGTGSDTLDGGDGIDNLFGGAGNDTFILNKNSADNIIDFEFSSDQLKISASAFGGGLVTNTSLLSTQLLVGVGISTTNSVAQRFIYNSGNGDLFFDADGSATSFIAIKIGNLGSNNNLGVNSFLIV
jgi:Ca2+-binding RTX toxin-like protein